MPAEAIGVLLTRIGAPLGLGKVVLEDDAEKIGFICEAGALGRRTRHQRIWRMARLSRLDTAGMRPAIEN